MDAINYNTLKSRQGTERDGYVPSLSLLVRRELSWLSSVEPAEAQNGRFIFQWGSFNVVCGTEIDEQYSPTEQRAFTSLLQKTWNSDSTKRIENAVWQECLYGICNLLNSPCAFKSSWDCQSVKVNEDEWQERFSGSKSLAAGAHRGRDTASARYEIFNRLYTLRNQLIHGGATCAGLLGRLVPLIIETMMSSPDMLWGAVYPNSPLAK